MGEKGRETIESEPFVPLRAPRLETIHVRLSEAGMDALDRHRGAWTRSEYIRRALNYAVKNGMKGPEQVEW